MKIKQQLAQDMDELRSDDHVYVQDDFYLGENTSIDYDDVWIEKAIALIRKIKSKNPPSLDEIMETDMKYWHKPDTAVRDRMFDIVHEELKEVYGKYWDHKKAPWKPLWESK